MNRLLALLVVLSFVVAACGTSADSNVPAANGSGATPAKSSGTLAAEPAVPPAFEPVTDRLAVDSESPMAEWVAGVNAAGWDFHRHLGGNAVSSPLSIGVAFSLSRAGASADTAAVLDEIFGFPEQGNHGAANAVDLSLSEASAEPNIVEVANRLFPDDGFSPRPEFLETAAAHYGATIQPVDTADGDAAAGVINDWVSGRTRGLIPVIVNQAAVQDQELVLVNTVYLKADWRTPFWADLTRDGTFTTGIGQQVTVPFMRDDEAIIRRYVQLEGADAVELPYVRRELAMWLIVPHESDGLAAVEASLDAAALADLSGIARTGTVDLTMPKWEQTLPPADLFEWLCPRGFCAGAGFDGIAPGIFITAALHGAKVIVDEKGTEAAAATVIEGDMSMPPPPDLTVVADRPFLWAIIHNDTQAILFVGRLTNPA
ncbi:serpin family protein [Candidatus Poriferisodalis sp.]|uniref:serpin family protein n=1 Tax=Candidatus Poriferisodalis sp. TaxID=3101277 RepID=UPI003B01930B